MIKTEAIIAVRNVEESSAWYQRLLNCASSHGGDTFETLTDGNGNHVLSLHKWGEHDHPTFVDPDRAGNGLILYFQVNDLTPYWENALQLKASIEKKPDLNPNSGLMEFSVRDLDNYYISVSAPNASGTD